jgi:rhamnose transport system substrate-binding protein
MISKKKFFAVGALALAAVMTMSACTSRTDAAPSSDGAGSGDITVAFVPKLQGIPYFEAMNEGGQKAADELGFTWLYQGPTTADAAAQADIVRSFIQQDVSVLIVAPNDPDSMAPLLQEAADKGIQVMTADTDAPNSVRSLFVNQASVDGIGMALTDQLLTAMGGSGEYAIVSCGETAANLNAWIEVQKSYAAEKYPEATLVGVVYAGEDQAVATSMATDLMNANPNLTGLVGECTSSAPGVAQAVADAGKIGQVFTVGLGTPMSMAPYLEDGSSTASVLWDVQNLGYLAAWAGLQLAQGNAISAINNVSSTMGAVVFDSASKVLLLGDPLVITKDNVSQFSY